MNQKLRDRLQAIFNLLKIHLEQIENRAIKGTDIKPTIEKLKSDVYDPLDILLREDRPSTKFSHLTEEQLEKEVERLESKLKRIGENPNV